MPRSLGLRSTTCRRSGRPKFEYIRLTCLVVTQEVVAATLVNRRRPLAELERPSPPKMAKNARPSTVSEHIPEYSTRRPIVVDCPLRSSVKSLHLATSCAAGPIHSLLSAMTLPGSLLHPGVPISQAPSHT